MVRDPEVAASVVQLLKDDDAGRAALLLGSALPLTHAKLLAGRAFAPGCPLGC